MQSLQGLEYLSTNTHSFTSLIFHHQITTLPIALQLSLHIVVFFSFLNDTFYHLFFPSPSCSSHSSQNNDFKTLAEPCFLRYPVLLTLPGIHQWNSAHIWPVPSTTLSPPLLPTHLFAALHSGLPVFQNCNFLEQAIVYTAHASHFHQSIFFLWLIYFSNLNLISTLFRYLSIYHFLFKYVFIFIVITQFLIYLCQYIYLL